MNKISNTTNSVKVGKLAEDLYLAFKSRISTLLIGRAGVGKTALVQSAWKKLCSEVGGDPIVVVDTPACSDPTDYKGLPVVLEGKATFDPIGLLRRLLNATQPTLCFLDDLGQASEAVQKGLQHIIWAREVEGRRIPDCVQFVGATNARTDRAGVGWLISPLIGRFDATIEVLPDLEHWSQWAVGAGISPQVLSFLQFRPDRFAEEPTAEFAKKVACPRSWEAVDKVVKAGLVSPAWLSGAIGQSAGLDLFGFLNVYDGLADLPHRVLNEGEKAPLPQKPEVRWALTGALVAKLNALKLHGHEKSAENFFAYIPRLGGEFEAFAVKSATKAVENFTTWETYGKWVEERGQVLILK
jgi:hypothetical protein